MGYFPNGTEGDLYFAKYCERCLHRDGQDGKSGCAVWLAHMLHNYDECNNDKSILNLLIPVTERLDNVQCTMFTPCAP